MDLVDFILFPIYCTLFYLIVRYRSKRYNDPLLKIYYRNAFVVRTIACLAFSIYLVYLSPGDSYSTYYHEASNIYEQSLKDFSVFPKMILTSAKDIDPSLFSDNTIGAAVFFDENNYMVVRIATVILFASFGKYLIANLIFSLLAFEGCWKLFKFFYYQYPILHKQCAIAILYFPTLIFWSSGISKEAICIAGIGYITYGCYLIFIKRIYIIRNIILVLIFLFFLSNVKIYILICFMPFLINYLIAANVILLKNRYLKMFLGPIILVVSFLIGWLFLMSNQDSLGGYALDGISESIKTEQNNFILQETTSESNFNFTTEYDGTPIGLLKLAPSAIGTTLFRPFLWEVTKLSTLLSALEASLVILLTIYVLYKTKFIHVFKIIITTPIVFFCFSFSIAFSLFVGASTLNFGSLVRYKIPAMPFYLIAMFLILYFHKLANPVLYNKTKNF